MVITSVRCCSPLNRLIHHIIMIVVLLLKSLTYLIQHPPGTYANQMAFLLQQTLQTLTPSATPSIGNLLSQLQMVSQSNNIHTSKQYLMYEYNLGARTSSAARRCCFRLTAASTATTSCRTSCSCCVTCYIIIIIITDQNHQQHLFHNNINRPLFIIIHIRFLLAVSITTKLKQYL